jgi:hypothetical protein
MRHTFSKLAILGAAFAVLIGLTVLITGKPASPNRVGVVDDWSHHHLIFSNPGTFADAMKTGSFLQWYKIVNDPRFQMQQMKRSSGVKTLVDGGTTGVTALADPRTALVKLPAKKKGLHKDWTQTLIADGQVQPNMFPAKFSFSTTTASCSADFVVYPTGVAGGTGAANIIAYNELYGSTTTGCDTTVPSVHWAYNTGTGDMITTSPVISRDGTQVAFIQVTGTTASLVLLKWAASTTETLTAPGTPTAATTSTYRACTAPCMLTMTLSGSPNDTYSAPFYDYASDDALYVGDNASKLHKFTGVFTGTPAEATPVTLNTTSYDVASPVYDPTSGCVFVGDSEGYLYSVSSGVAGSVCTGSSFALYGHSENLGDGAALEGIFDAPLVDSAAGMVYAFLTYSAVIGNCSTAGDNCVDQFKTSTITSGSTTAAPYNEEPLGTGGANYNLYAGAFDNVYYSSTNGTAGNLWVMGNTGTSGGNLYRIPISSAGAMQAPVTAVATLTAYHPWPSPITEFCNNGTSACVSNGTATTAGIDYLFFSINRGDGEGSCTNASGDGCVLAYTVTTPTSPTLSGSALLTTPAAPGCWSTGGIIVDNAVPTGTGTGELTGASEVYLLELNGNGAGGPTHGTYTSSNCTTGDTATPIALQGAQSSP